MPSAKHQELVFWLARKVLWDGYFPIGFDGENHHRNIFNKISVSFSIGGVRPDVIAVNPLDLLVAFGEAKTEGDLWSSHSQIQLKAMASYQDPLGRPAQIYLGVPQSIHSVAIRQIATLGLRSCNNFQVVPIPDIFLPEAENV